MLNSIHVLSDPAEFLQKYPQITPGSTTQTHNIVVYLTFQSETQAAKLGLVSGLSLQKRRLRPFQAFWGRREEGWGGGSWEGSASLQKDVCELRGVPVLERTHI